MKIETRIANLETQINGLKNLLLKIASTLDDHAQTHDLLNEYLRHADQDSEPAREILSKLT